MPYPKVRQPPRTNRQTLKMPNTALPAAPDIDRATAHYAVRIGIHGQVGRFAAGSHHYSRGAQVICRTARGLEVGQVLGALEWTSIASTEEFDGRIVRLMAAEDRLLWNQLKRLAEDAHTACQAWLTNSGLPDRLLDVEPLLDGRTLYFHFLDTASAETEVQTEKLAQIFQQTVSDSAFSKLVEAGCGPGCGTDKAKGCGSACSACVSRCGIGKKNG
jgi:hypothetical protein